MTDFLARRDDRTGDVVWQDAHGYEHMPLPHVLTFSSIIGAAWRSYYHGQHDDAIRNDPEFANAMRRDPLLMAMLQERKAATVNRKWHISVSDSNNPQHKAVADGIKLVLDQIPRKRIMFDALLEAIWFGRYGVQLGYEDKVLSMPSIVKSRLGGREKVKVPVPLRHEPIHGDKIGYTYAGTPYIQIYSPRQSEIPHAKIIPTTASRSIELVGEWRSKFVIHMHQSLDAPYWSGEQAGSIYGVGVRHVLYWLSWLKRELLANILTYAERTGMGLRMWKYQAGNKESKDAVEDAALNQTDRTNILVPVNMTGNGRPVEGVEFVETGSSMSTLLLEILRHFDEEIERFVVGQSLSSGTEGSGLGGSGVAGLHATTKHNLTEFDAENLGETMTLDMIRPLAYWIYPKSLVDEACPRFQFDVAPPDPVAALSAVSAAVAMGGEFDAEAVEGLAGVPGAKKGSRKIGAIQLQEDMAKSQQKLQSAMQSAMAGQAGQPVGPDGQPAGGQLAPQAQSEAPTEADFAAILSAMGAAGGA